jgi:chemotaxis protein MotA
MADADPQKNTTKLPTNFDFKPARSEFDFATIGGLFAAILLIALALVLGGQYRIFYDSASLLIVVGGTVAITLMATTWTDLAGTLAVLKNTISTSRIDQRRYAKQLIDLSMIVRQKGIINLQTYEAKLRTDGFLMRAIRLIADGIKPEEIEQLLKQEIDSSLHRQENAVKLLRRAADIAPAMGLIGTLVGLVQMLGKLEEPSTIGPSMALALLTTFYGAILGTVILTPLSTKLEKRAEEDMMQKVLVLSAALSMARLENPRLLEMQLNTLLAPKNRIKYFEE